MDDPTASFEAQRPEKPYPGALIARHIEELLDYRIDYQDDHGVFEQLKDLLSDVKALETGGFDDAHDAAVQVIQGARSKAVDDTVRNWKNRLEKDGRVAVLDDSGRRTWEVVADDDKHRYLSILELNGYTDDVDPAEDDTSSDDDSLQPEFGEVYDTGVADLISQINEKLVSLNDTFRVKEMSFFTRLGRFVARKQVGADDLTTEVDMDEPLVKEVRKLMRLLRRFATDPARMLIGQYLDELHDSTYEQSREEFEQAIAQENTELFTPVEKVKIRPIMEKDVLARTKTVSSTDKEMDRAGAETQSSNGEEIVSEQGPIQVSFPWLNNGQATELPVTMVEYQGQTVGIIHAIDPRLAKIANNVRMNATEDEQGRNEYDAIAIKLARMIAGGVLPYQNTNSVKRVKHVGEKAPKYRDLTIWYSFDISPNAPRVYFTLMNGADINPSDKKIADHPYIVVVAETDMQNQVRTLASLTGLSSANLVKTGAGAV